LRAETTPEGLNYTSTKKADLVNAYIENQAEHHQAITLQDELRELLTTYQTEYDERYWWG